MLPIKLTKTPQETEYAAKIDCIKLKHSLYVGHTVQTIVRGSGTFKRMPW